MGFAVTTVTTKNRGNPLLLSHNSWARSIINWHSMHASQNIVVAFATAVCDLINDAFQKKINVVKEYCKTHPDKFDSPLCPFHSL